MTYRRSRSVPPHRIGRPRGCYPRVPSTKAVRRGGPTTFHQPNRDAQIKGRSYHLRRRTGVRWLDCCSGSSSAQSRTRRSGVRARRHCSGFVKREVSDLLADPTLVSRTRTRDRPPAERAAACVLVRPNAATRFPAATSDSGSARLGGRRSIRAGCLHPNKSVDNRSMIDVCLSAWSFAVQARNTSQLRRRGAGVDVGDRPRCSPLSSPSGSDWRRAGAGPPTPRRTLRAWRSPAVRPRAVRVRARQRRRRRWR